MAKIIVRVVMQLSGMLLLSLTSAPQAQRAVPVQIADGVLVVDGSVSNLNMPETSTKPFVLDSAATTTIIDLATAQTLGSAGVAGKQLREKTLRMAGAEVTRLPMLMFALKGWAQQTGLQIAGIAGEDIFSRFAVRIDYANARLTLLVPQSCAVTTPHIVLRVIGGLPFLDAELTGADGKVVRGMFLLDTGQSGSGLVLTHEFLAAHPGIAGRQILPEVLMVNAEGQVEKARALRVPEMQLGGHALRGAIATIAPGAPANAGAALAGVIGGGVLSRFDVLIDMRNRWLTLTPNAHYPDAFEADMSGMLLLTGESGERSGERVYMVAGIEQKSPAAEAGLQEGDRILEVAGRGISGMSLDLVRSVFKSSPGAKVLVSIDRSGRKMSVILTLKRAV